MYLAYNFRSFRESLRATQNPRLRFIVLGLNVAGHLPSAKTLPPSCSTSSVHHSLPTGLRHCSSELPCLGWDPHFSYPGSGSLRSDVKTGFPPEMKGGWMDEQVNAREEGKDGRDKKRKGRENRREGGRKEGRSREGRKRILLLNVYAL